MIRIMAPAGFALVGMFLIQCNDTSSSNRRERAPAPLGGDTAAGDPGTGDTSPGDASTGDAGGDSGSATLYGAETYCGRLTARLDLCGASGAQASTGCPEPATQYAECHLGCFIVVATCDDLGAWLCGGGSYSVDLQNCFSACEAMTFECEPGEVIAASQVCDLVVDCSNASDETDNCSTFTCLDGKVIPGEQECNGVAECTDNSDEHGSCGEPFMWQITRALCAD